MALDHAGHQALAAEVEDGVAGGRFRPPAIRADRDDAVVLDHDHAVRLGSINPVDQICPGEKYPFHNKFSLLAQDPNGGTIAIGPVAIPKSRSAWTTRNRVPQLFNPVPRPPKCDHGRTASRSK